MRIIILAVLAVMPVLMPAQEVWRVTAGDGSTYAVGHTKAEALRRGERRSELEGVKDPVFSSSRYDGSANPQDRLAVETAIEILLRLEKLAALTGGDRDSQVTFLRTMIRYQEANDKLRMLNQGLEEAFTDVALGDLQASKTPDLDVRLLAEPHPISSFAGVPNGFLKGYLALIERIDGYRRPNTQTTGPSRKRDQLLKAQVVVGGETRFVFESIRSNGRTLTLSYRVVSRSETERKEVAVADLWQGKSGQYKLASTKVEMVAPFDFAVIQERIVQEARSELSRVQEREERRQEEARMAAKDRQKREAEAKRLEQERKEREERERRDQETRRQQREEYVRQASGLESELDRVARERDDAANSLPDARRDYDSKSASARQAKEAKDTAAGRVRDLESELEQAKRDNKPTGLIEGVLREARQQFESKKDQYNDADRRADAARDRVDSLERIARDRKQRADEIEGELRRLKSLIDSLGG